MEIKMVDLGPIAVIGKEGVCTRERNIVSELWENANANFSEIAALGMKEQDGSYVGFWGLMSDVGRQYLPWEDDFTTGLYLAGLEVSEDTPVPDGWVKWIVPKRTYLVLEIENGRYMEAFRCGLEELPKRSLKLSGAVCDYTAPGTGKNYLFYPCEKQ